WRIGCAIAPLAGGGFTVVRLGAAGAANAALAAADDRRVGDRHYLTSPVRGRLPAGVRVHFKRRELYAGTEETTPRTSAQWQTSGVSTVDVGAAADDAGGEPGVYPPLHDDLPALYDATGALTNAGALATRAAARAADYYRALHGDGGDRMLK